VDHLGEILIDMLQENPYPFSSKVVSLLPRHPRWEADDCYRFTSKLSLQDVVSL